MKLVIPAPGPSRGRLFLYTRRGLAGNYRQRSLVSKGLLCYRVFFRDPSLTAGIPKGLTMENPDDIGLFGVASERAALAQERSCGGTSSPMERRHGMGYHRCRTHTRYCVPRYVGMVHALSSMWYFLEVVVQSSII